MAESAMKYGACKGRMSRLRRWIANASAKDISIFPIPGADILRLYQNETQQNFIISPNSREANVLLVVGELTDALAQKAGVAYQQIPRPRVLVIAGSVQTPYLPEPDVQVSLGDGFLDDALPQIRQLLEDHAWSEDAEPWEPEFLTEIVDDSDDAGGHNHPHDHDYDDGGEEGHDHHNHGEENHKEEKDGDGGHNHDSEGEDNHDHGDDDEDGGHDHSDMDFMSMVAMTKDLPRPEDGLPMNRSEVYIGPFHPGLPGGLSVFTELDGDTVIKAEVEHELVARSMKEFLPLAANQLPDLLSSLNPLTPATYRLLSRKTLQRASQESRKVSLTANELLVLEHERIASHLNWLAVFAKTIGNNWLCKRAAYWHSLSKKEQIEFKSIQPFLERIRNMPYLEMKLKAGKGIPEKLLNHLSGPVAKAAGKGEDARLHEELYQQLTWQPITKNENNSWGHLLVRLDEIQQSVHLIEEVKDEDREEKTLDFTGSGEGNAQIEGPRGILALRLSIREGKIEDLQIETPSTALAALVHAVVEEEELSDALVKISSLDISPWEIQLKGRGE